MSKSIKFWNRARNREEPEEVYGEFLVNLLYGTRPGQGLADHVLTRPWLSRFYGMYQGTSLSKHKIRPFIRKFNINMEEFEDPGFKSFNDFFIRKFKPGARIFATEANRMSAFAEARYLAFEKISSEQVFPVKGTDLTPAQLLGSEAEAQPFLGGPLMIARLCPVDYHRFHYPDAGRTLRQYPVYGKLHSVNPTALRYRSEIFITNERQVSLLQTENFGLLAYIEVGAMCVGKIVQTYDSNRPFSRGDEKGYFLFGGSTVILLGEPGRWKPDADILERTLQSQEAFVLLGEGIATSST